ncbi:NAD-dependent epimerase/dehydratase family protein [Pseudanabaena sp. BC1403]|uniref:NAD-dependent epimerase/dehydratase family protein n=1 Tax=Pseudanabaena sp. BC1403 TaxID=2043171 RepID=UPI000CD8245A|nr:NAD-dependent epimerase/dehydratase family protein [Pseudanabaena sp. BC1403]
MEILVTGATGFLGTALCVHLENLGHKVYRLNSKNCDLQQGNSLLKFNQIAYDQIYHLAAWTQAGDFCLYHQGEQWIVNQRINTNVLSWWQQYQPQAKLISMGTSCAYSPELPLTEENYLMGMPIDSLFTYAMTKRMLYAGHLALQKQYGLKYLCLVPSTLYGPGYHTDGRQMHFIFDLIRKIIWAKLYDETVILWGDGNQCREIVFVDDFVNISIHLANNIDNQIINIGAGEEFSIKYFAKLICENVGYDFDLIQFDTERYVGAKSKCLEVQKLRHYIPDLSLTSLELGLGKTIDWFREQRPQFVPRN